MLTDHMDHDSTSEVSGPSQDTYVGRSSSLDSFVLQPLPPQAEGSQSINGMPRSPTAIQGDGTPSVIVTAAEGSGSDHRPGDLDAPALTSVSSQQLLTALSLDSIASQDHVNHGT